MRKVYGVLGWGIIALGILHMASTPRAVTASAVWFFSGGIVMVLTGALNLLSRAYGGTAPGLRWFCVGTNAVMTAFALVAGWVGRASVGQLATIVGWMGATTVLSFLRSAVRTMGEREHMSDANDRERHSPLDAATRDKSSPVWDMSQERVFIENLLNQRFSFFLVVFSLVLAGAINSKAQLHLQIVLTLGAIVTTLFAAVLGRSQEKLDLILTDLFTDRSHPAAIIDSRAKKRGSRRRLIGVWIPRICCLVLIVGAALAWFGVLQVARVGP